MNDEMFIVENVIVKCRYTTRKTDMHKKFENDLLKKIIITKKNRKKNIDDF